MVTCHRPGHVVVLATSLTLLAAVWLISTACSDSSDAEATTGPTPIATWTLEPIPTVPGSADRAMLSGRATLDGAPLDAQFLGVRVIRDGLVGACQDAIPSVLDGQYEIPVAADAEVRGCGAPGAELILWTFVSDLFLYSTTTAPWPGNGASATFDVAFSSSDAAGASKPVTQFKGLPLDSGGNRLPAGTVIQAYVGDVLCGVTSLRHGEATEGLYTLLVAGPDSVAGCDAGATITFRLDGQPAVETAINDLDTSSEGHDLDLHLQ